MKPIVQFLFHRLVKLHFLVAGIFCLLSPMARAGLTVDIHLYHTAYGYYFYPWLNANATPPDFPLGDYYVASPQIPTNGATMFYQATTNGIGLVTGGAGYYSSFDSLLDGITNGQWSIWVTNAVSTNQYKFTVTVSGVTSNGFGAPTVISFPADGAQNVTSQPTFQWSGPTDWAEGFSVIDYYIDNDGNYNYEASDDFSDNQTSWPSPVVLPYGTNQFSVNYSSNVTAQIIASAPLDGASQPISGWVSTATLEASSSSTFVVGATNDGSHTLIAHYDFDEDETVAPDVSGSGNNIVLAGNFGGDDPAISSDSISGAGSISFDGGSFLTAPSSLLPTIAGTFSLSLWIKTTDNSGYEGDLAWDGACIVSADNPNTGVNGDIIPVALTGGQVAFNTGNADADDDDTINSSTLVNDGQWHHIVVMRNQLTGEKDIYIDGTLDVSGFATTSLLTDPQILTIGCKADASNSDPDSPSYTGSNGYNGLVDDIQIYDRVLTSDEIAFLHDNPGATVAGGADFSTALDATNLNWTTGGDIGWFTESTNTYDGVSAAQSGTITDGQNSWLETTVPADGQISFYWKVSSEETWDTLTFYINGEEQDIISGEVDWSQETYSVSAGDVLRWEYTKDPDCCASGADAGFLDEVNFIIDTNTLPMITINPFSQTNYPGYRVALYAAASGTPPITWQWYKEGIGTISGATNAFFVPADSGNSSVAGDYYAIATNIKGSTNTLSATITFADEPLPPDWSVVFKSSFADNADATNSNYNIAAVLDSAGNIYSVGQITGTNTFGGTPLIANGPYASSFLKQTATGVPIWGRSMIASNGSSYAQCVQLMPDGGIVASGNFVGTNWLGTNQLIDIGGSSTYIARFDANGNNLWVRTITGTNANFGEYHRLVTDSSGNVTFSVLVFGYTSFGSTNVFVDGQRGALVQYDLNGNFRWLQLPSSWPNYLTYNNGRIYGTMSGSATDYIGGLTNSSDRGAALFALDAGTGQGIWLRKIGAAQGQNNPSGFVDNDPVVAVSGTNVFVAGSAWGDAVFGPFTVTFPADKGQYLARFDTNGNAQLAMSFGSQFTWPWAAAADAAGNVYVSGDFDTYSVFGSNIIAAPFYDTVQYIGSGDAQTGPFYDRIPGQTFLAKFNHDGHPLWVRQGQSTSYVNSRDIVLAPDGIWSCGFFSQTAEFGTNAFSTSGIEGFMAKITDGSESFAAQAVTILNPQIVGGDLQLSFLSQIGFINNIEYRTNLTIGSWQVYSGTNVTGDGTLKQIQIPVSIFNGSPQGFIRVTTQ